MTRVFPIALIVAVACLSSAVVGRARVMGFQSTGTPPPPDFPEGEGKALAVRLCKDCHPVTQITRRHESRARWSTIVEQMIKEGADIRDDDFEPLVSYLSVAMGKKVKINEATAKEIGETFDIEADLAAAIVKYRTDKGPFKDWKDIANVPGVDPKRIEEQKGNLDFGG